MDLLRYHAGWNFALNRQVGDELFHPTPLVNFRQRWLEHDLSTIGFDLVLEELVAAGLVARHSRQRLDSTQMLGRVSRMSRLDCVRESLRLALAELAEQIPAPERPGWWPQLWVVCPRAPLPFGRPGFENWEIVANLGFYYLSWKLPPRRRPRLLSEPKTHAEKLPTSHQNRFRGLTPMTECFGCKSLAFPVAFFHYF